MNETTLKNASIALAHHCVRNTSTLETLHSKGVLSQDDMKNINIEVSNKIYTTLTVIFNGHSKERDYLIDLIMLMAQGAIKTWDEPVFDESWNRAVKEIINKG